MSILASAPNITLYGLGTSRSARCRWAALELDMEFEYIEDRTLLRSARLRKLQPLAKLPAAVINGKVVFESAAICTYLCDLHGDNALIAAPGSYARALHEQWASFVLTELEAYLWSNAKHTAMYAQELRVAAVVPRNNDEIALAMKVLNDHLATTEYLVEGSFSVTDIIAGWTINWARRTGHWDSYTHLHAYVERLFARPHCTLNRE